MGDTGVERRRVEMTNFLPHTGTPGQAALGSVTALVKDRRRTGS